MEIGEIEDGECDRIQCDMSAKLQQLARELTSSLYVVYSVNNHIQLFTAQHSMPFYYFRTHSNLILFSETISETNNY